MSNFAIGLNFERECNWWFKAYIYRMCQFKKGSWNSKKYPSSFNLSVFKGLHLCPCQLTSHLGVSPLETTEKNSSYGHERWLPHWAPICLISCLGTPHFLFFSTTLLISSNFPLGWWLSLSGLIYSGRERKRGVGEKGNRLTESKTGNKN